METRTKDWLLYTLGVCVIVCAAGMVGALVRWEVPAGNRDLVHIALGSLLSMAVTVVQYFFGSSRSSADKTAALQEQSKALIARAG